MSSAKSMAYRVEITDRGVGDLASIYEFIEAGTSEAAARWFSQLEALIMSLNREPHRGLRTPEDKKLLHLLHGNKPHIYRIIYSIDRTQHRILILHIRHGARGPFNPGELLT